MGTMYIIRGPLHRVLLRSQTVKVVTRGFAFKGRPEHLGQGTDKAPKDNLLPSTPARTRFAPSPTGYLHLGSLRTALYNYLLAKATGGEFLLRLEDTDQARLVQDAEPRLYEDLKWAGLSWDEGPDIGGPFGPYKQSERLDLYHSHATQLLDAGQAYRCFCTPEELDALKLYNMQNADGSSSQATTHYSGKCSHIPAGESDRRAAAGEPHCVRIRSTGNPEVRDLVYGRYSRPEREDDFILIKRDRFPTYHFANVVDDHAMQVTHVIRGAEWLTSTPRHVMLYDAFKWSPPTFAHVGLLCNSKGQKLSKRSGDIDISSYRNKGILPVALLNYSILLGWSPGRAENEVLDLEAMIKKFHLRFTKGNIKISSKLPFLQSKHTSALISSLTRESFDAFFLRPMRQAVAAAPASLPELNGLPRVTGDADDDDAAHLYAVFASERKAYNGEMDKFVARNRWLVWGPPPAEAYAASLESALLHPIDRLRRMDRGLGGTVDSTPLDLIKAFQRIFEDVPADRWGRDALDGPVSELIKDIYQRPPPPPAVEGEDSSSPAPRPEEKPWGNQVLRYILFAGQTGPSLLPSLEILGREEVLRRAQLAANVAEPWEKGI